MGTTTPSMLARWRVRQSTPTIRLDTEYLSGARELVGVMLHFTARDDGETNLGTCVSFSLPGLPVELA